MPAPEDVLSQLLSPSQSGILSTLGSRVWSQAANVLVPTFGDRPEIESVSGRLVMPDEIAGDFADAHIAIPVIDSLDDGREATALIAVPTPAGAERVGTLSDDPEELEPQTMIALATLASGAVAAVNTAIFGDLSAGLVLNVDDALPNGMAALLAGIDDPALLLSLSIGQSNPVPITVLLPGPFLELVSAALLADTVQPATSSIVPPTPEPAFAAPEPDEMPQQAIEGSRGVDSDDHSRDPLPISQAPAAHRARFAPIPDPDPAPATRHGMDLLAGLHMNVVVELGRTELTVAEVLALGPGSVVELDRLSGEPVDILVNERLIARGEVVVVDENFGVRVVEVVRRGADVQERAG